MNPFLYNIVINVAKKNLQKKQYHSSHYDLAKELYKLRVASKYLAKDLILIILGVLSAGFGLKGFLLPNNFIDGGITGISLMTSGLTGISLSLALIVINLPFIFLGYTQINKRFALRSILTLAALALCVEFINYPVITNDKLLVAVFGGVFLGMGIGLTIRGGAVLDGTEVLAIYLSNRFSFSIGDFILFFNFIIFSVAAWLLSVEIALYSILIYFAASKMVDYILEGLEEFIGVFIVSNHHSEIRQMIFKELGHGITIFNGKKGFGHKGETEGRDILYVVMSRLEVRRLTFELEKIDPNAFVIMNKIKDVKGGMFKRYFNKKQMKVK